MSGMGSEKLFKSLRRLLLHLVFGIQYSKNPVLSDHSKRRPKIGFKTDYRLMQVKSIVEHSAILSTFI